MVETGANSGLPKKPQARPLTQRSKPSKDIPLTQRSKPSKDIPAAGLPSPHVGKRNLEQHVSGKTAVPNQKSTAMLKSVLSQSTPTRQMFEKALHDTAEYLKYMGHLIDQIEPRLEPGAVPSMVKQFGGEGRALNTLFDKPPANGVRQFGPHGRNVDAHLRGSHVSKPGLPSKTGLKHSGNLAARALDQIPNPEQSNGLKHSGELKARDLTSSLGAAANVDARQPKENSGLKFHDKPSARNSESNFKEGFSMKISEHAEEFSPTGNSHLGGVDNPIARHTQFGSEELTRLSEGSHTPESQRTKDQIATQKLARELRQPMQKRLTNDIRELVKRTPSDFSGSGGLNVLIINALNANVDASTIQDAIDKGLEERSAIDIGLNSLKEDAKPTFDPHEILTQCVNALGHQIKDKVLGLIHQFGKSQEKGNSTNIREAIRQAKKLGVTYEAMENAFVEGYINSIKSDTPNHTPDQLRLAAKDKFKAFNNPENQELINELKRHINNYNPANRPTKTILMSNIKQCFLKGINTDAIEDAISNQLDSVTKSLVWEIVLKVQEQLTSDALKMITSRAMYGDENQLKKEKRKYQNVCFISEEMIEIAENKGKKQQEKALRNIKDYASSRSRISPNAYKGRIREDLIIEAQERTNSRGAAQQRTHSRGALDLAHHKPSRRKNK